MSPQILPYVCCAHEKILRTDIIVMIQVVGIRWSYFSPTRSSIFLTSFAPQIVSDGSSPTFLPVCRHFKREFASMKYNFTLKIQQLTISRRLLRQTYSGRVKERARRCWISLAYFTQQLHFAGTCPDIATDGSRQKPPDTRGVDESPGAKVSFALQVLLPPSGANQIRT